MSEHQFLGITIALIFMFLDIVVFIKTKSNILKGVLTGFLLWLIMLFLFLIEVLKVTSLESMAIIPWSLPFFLLLGLIIGAVLLSRANSSPLK